MKRSTLGMSRSARAPGLAVAVLGCLALLSTADAPLAADVSADLSADMARFLQWFPGEYDNNEQVWQQRQDGVQEKELHERIHHHFVPVDLPQIGEHVFFVSQTMDDNPEDIYRQRIYVFEADEEKGAVRLTIYRMRDEERYRDGWREPAVLESLAREDLIARPGCEVYWRFRDGYFEGTMEERACHFYSERMGKEIYITDTLRLTESEIWIGDKAFDEDGNRLFGREVPHINRKVRRFSGWMGIRRDRVDSDYAGDDMVFMPRLEIHNEGGRQSLRYESGEPTGYAIELAQLTYQNTKVPILKLGLIEESSGKTVSYTWTSTDASRIGMNLRWFQAGLTAKEP